MRDALIGSTPLRAGEELRVTVSDYRGTTYCHVRRYYLDGETWQPGKGVAFRALMLPWVLAMLRVAEGELVREGRIELEDYEQHGLEVPAAFMGWLAR